MRLRQPRRTIGRRSFDFDRQLAVMAIVNRTPDSFYDGGRTFELDRAVAGALAAAAAGADWVDVGGLAFSPDVPDQGERGEIDRVVPVVASVAAASDVVISVDTWRVGVARAAIEAGAAVINDTSGLRDPAMADLAAETGATLVITHSLAAPHRHLRRPVYRDVAAEVRDLLAARVELARAHGVREEQLIIDPGHDLNKNTVQTLELTRRLEVVTELGLPTLAAVSNKDFVGEALGRAREDRLAGSLAAATWCVARGARVLRMHEVGPAVDVARMCEAILGWRAPVTPRHNLGLVAEAGGLVVRIPGPEDVATVAAVLGLDASQAAALVDDWLAGWDRDDLGGCLVERDGSPIGILVAAPAADPASVRVREHFVGSDRSADEAIRLLLAALGRSGTRAGEALPRSALGDVR